MPVIGFKYEISNYIFVVRNTSEKFTFPFENMNEELDSIVENYIKGTKEINWEKDLETLGIQSSEENSFVKLKVKAKFSGRQKDLLDKLGYNNWRKISGKSK